MSGVVAFLVVLVVVAMITVMASNMSRARRMSVQNDPQYFIDPLTGQPIQPQDQGFQGGIQHGGHHGSGQHGGGGFGGSGHDGGHHGGGFSGGGGGDSGGGGHHH